MSAVIAAPQLMEAAATDLSAIGSTLDAAHILAAAPTISVLPAAADEVSAGIADLFSGYARDYQKLAGQAAALHQQFVQHLTAAAVSYAGAEAANVALLLQPLLSAEGPVVGPATSTLDALSFYLGEMSRRLSTIISNSPALFNSLLQEIIANPTGTIFVLPAFLLIPPLLVLAPIGPFVLIHVFPTLANYLMSLADTFFPLLGPNLFWSIGYPLLAISLAIPQIPLYLLYLLYIATGGALV